MRDNVYDIRRNKCLYFILPQENNAIGITNSKTVIIIYLYYQESLDYYLEFVGRVPETIDVCIISSEESVLEYCRNNLKKNNKFYYIKKENRGRDISALLIESNRILNKYDYACFLHDKKTHEEQKEKDTAFWIENLWSNCIESEKYIYSVIDLFEKNNNIGVLVPPEPLGLYHTSWLGDGWYGSFDITQSLVKKMGLKCNLSERIPPISLGTVLWFRVCALRKLFDYAWNYEIFDDDKLRVDTNYISYGVERIFPYVAQDGGYDTGTIMCRSYAEKQIALEQSIATDMLYLLKKYKVANIPLEIKEMRKRFEVVDEIVVNNFKVFIYGAGIRGKRCLEFLLDNKIVPEAFLVTKDKSDVSINGVCIMEADEVITYKDSFVIIAVSNKRDQKMIKNKLDDLGCNRVAIFS